MMTDLLKFEADTITLQVIYNSIGNREFAQLSDIDAKRKNLCPKMGYLYPDYTDHLIKTRNLESLREELKGQTLYQKMLKDVPDPLKGEEFDDLAKSLDDIMMEVELKKYSMAFDQQC